MVKAGQGGRWDAVIVGGGHNGLVAGVLPGPRGAAHARPRAAGDRRRRLRHRGVRARLPRVDRRLRAQHAAQSDLARHAARRARPHRRPRRAPASTCSPTATAFLLDDDTRPHGRGDRAASRPPTPAAWPAFEAALGELAAPIGPLIDATPPDPAAMHPRDLLGMARLGGRALRTAARCSRSATCSRPRSRSTWTSGSSPITSRRRSAGTRSTTASPARARPARRTCSSTTTPPRRPAAACAAGASSAAASARSRGDGRRRARGGRRDPHRGAGRAGARRRRRRDRRRARVRRGDRGGDRALERRSEAHVPDAVRRGRPARAVPRRGRCLPLRGHQHQDQPGGRPAARGGRDERQRRRAGLPARDHGVHLRPSPTWTAPRTRRGRAGSAGHPHIEVCIPTVHDPSLAPDGHHVVTIDVNSQPYTWPREAWDDLKRRGRRPRDRARWTSYSRACRRRSCTARCSPRSTSSGCSA